MKLTHFYRTIPWSYDRQGNGAGRQVLWLENQKTSGGQRVSQTGNVRRDEHHDTRCSQGMRLATHEKEKTKVLPQESRNRACHRALQGRSSIGEELLQGSLG